MPVRATPLPLLLALLTSTAAACTSDTHLDDVVVRVSGAATWSRGLSPAAPVLFLNRCPDGCTIRPGPDDSRRDRSSIPTSTATLAPFPWSDDVWERALACVAQEFAAYELTVTDVDPGDAPHFENVVSGRPSDLGLPPSIGGIASFDCGVIPDAMSFTFAAAIGDDPTALCVTIAHEAGHNFGLEHEMACSDPMTYLPACGEQRFLRADVPCGEHRDRPCSCGLPYQNSYLSLLGAFGPRTTPLGARPHVEITRPRYDDARVEPRFIVFAEASDDGEVLQVSLAIDGVEVGTSTLAPHVFYAPESLSSGTHVLMATATDDLGLTDTTTRTVELLVPPPRPHLDAGTDRDASGEDAEVLLTPDAGEVRAPGPADAGGCTCVVRPPAGARAGALLLALFAFVARRGRRRPSASSARGALSRARATLVAVALSAAACGDGTGLGLVNAHLELSPAPGSALRFDEVVLGRTTAAPIILTAKSLGPGAVSLASPTIEGPDADAFFVRSAPRTLAPRQTWELYVRFRPTQPRAHHAELVLRSNDPRHAESRWPLSGDARDPCVLRASPPYLRLEVGESKDVTLEALTTQPCTVDRWNLDFTLFDVVAPAAPPILVPAGGSATLRVKHTQRTLEPGLPIRTLTVRESEGTSTAVSLEGQPPAWGCIEAFPPRIELPSAPLGVPVDGRIVVTNTCDTRVHVLAGLVTLGGGYYEVNGARLPVAVDPFGTASVWVRYLPFSAEGDAGEVQLDTDDALRRRLPVALVGHGLVPRAVALPEVAVGEAAWQAPLAPGGLSACRSARTIVPLFSAGDVDLVVRGVGLAPGGDPGFELVGASVAGVPVDTGRSITVPVGESLDVEVTFRPAHLQPAEHRADLVFEHAGIEGSTHVALVGQATAPGAVREVLTTRGPKVDVLFVVDDSASMAGPGARLESAAGAFLERAEAAGADYHVGVVRADGRSSSGGWLHGCGRHPWVLTSSWGDGSLRAADLACRLHVGATGRGPQAGIGAAMRAIEHAIAPTPTDGTVPSPNTELLRPDADLAVITVSNDDDQSAESPELARNYLARVTGPARRLTVHTLAGPLVGPCEDGLPFVTPGERYARFAALGGGAAYDVCAPDLGVALTAIADATFQPRARFPLRQAADPRSLRVELAGRVLPESTTDGYTYDPPTRLLELHGSAGSAPGLPLVVSYNALCAP